MSSSTILQLRQQESSDVLQNGVWTSTLDHPVELEEGDVVQVKSVYLDTVADTIELTEDEEITMEALIYIQNYNLDQEYPFPSGSTLMKTYQADATLRTEGNKGDNHLWFLSSAHVLAGTTNWNVPSFRIVPINTTSDTKRFGDITLEFEFTPITPGATKTTQSVHVKSFVDKRYEKHNPHTLGISCTGTAQGPTLVLKTTKAELTNAGIALVDFSTYAKLIPEGEVQIEPQRFPISFRIPRGTYTPSEISQTITDAVNNLQYSGPVSTLYGGVGPYPNPPTQANYPSMNPWLQTVLKNVKELNDLGGAAQVFVNADVNYGGAKGGGQVYFTYDVAQMIAQYAPVTPGPYKPPVDKFLGTNQFSMTFDEQENKIKITQMHFPIYANSTTTAGSGVTEDGFPSVIFNEVKANTTPAGLEGVFQPAGGLGTAYSGICFSSLSPGWFWDAMGFGQAIVTPTKNVKLEYPTFLPANVPTADNSYTLDVIVGTNTTSAFEGLDLPVIHSNKYAFVAPNDPQLGRYSVPRQDPQDGTDVYVSTPDVASIFSSKTLNDNIADEGYFLVEVGSNFKQNLVGGRLGEGGGLRTSKDTQSIVNRYYTSGSFTSDQGAGSIVYQHTGEPEMLSNLNIKVRNPNGTFVDLQVLKEKNAVFIEIVKQNKTK